MEKIIRFLYPEEQPDLTTLHSLSFRTNRLFPALKKSCLQKLPGRFFSAIQIKKQKKIPIGSTTIFLLGYTVQM
jgi:hypothetical protein